MTSLIWATLWPHSLIPHKLKAAVRSFSVFFFFFFFFFFFKFQIQLTYRKKLKAVNNNIPPEAQGWSTWPKFKPPRALPAPDDSLRSFLRTPRFISAHSGYFTMLMFAQTATDLHSLSSSQSPALFWLFANTICGEKRKRDAEEEGRWESRWAPPCPHVPSHLGKDRLCARQTATR